MSRFFHLYKNKILASKNIWQTSKAAKWCLVFSFLILGLMIAAPFFWLPSGNSLSSFIPLHYNIFFGIDRFGPWYFIFRLPALSLVFILVNYFLALRFGLNNKVLFNFLVILTLVLQFILLAAEFFTILLNL